MLFGWQEITATPTKQQTQKTQQNNSGEAKLAVELDRTPYLLMVDT